MDGTWLGEVSHEVWSGVGRGGESYGQVRREPAWCVIWNDRWWLGKSSGLGSDRAGSGRNVSNRDGMSCRIGMSGIGGDSHVDVVRIGMDWLVMRVRSEMAKCGEERQAGRVWDGVERGVKWTGAGWIWQVK